MRGRVHDDVGPHVMMVEWNRDANTTVIAIQSVNILYKTNTQSHAHVLQCGAQ